MADVIDLTDFSSDDEDTQAKPSVSGVAKNHQTVREEPSAAASTSVFQGPEERIRKSESVAEVATSSPRLHHWGDPLPPVLDSSRPPDESLREKKITDAAALYQISNGSRFKDAHKVLPGAPVVLPRGKVSLPPPSTASAPTPAAAGVCRHFWRAGDYEVQPSHTRTIQSSMEHVRVHPKFLHSNATSHKWALGAVAELLDNAVDEVQNGATFVAVDKIVNPRDSSPALLVQDDGGGMTPDCMRQCMSLGYSRKNSNTTIGQYGNGFKTSTMRLGADVIVFSRCVHESIVTQSIGLLSYTFLRETGHEDVVVPMVDYEIRHGEAPRRILRTVIEDWHSNLANITQWSPYASEAELLAQFENLNSHGTKIVIYNLWFNDDGVLELDFDTDEEDIQLRGGVKHDKSTKQLAQQHIANRYHHSLRIYASILYLQTPPGFQIILRGKPVEHRNIASDLKFPEQIVYKPQIGNTNKETAVITVIGFTKEAPLINVHGFNVYHKNRLIMPFWKVWQDNSSRGRGVVGVLEANFVEPAHDKQDFERTAVFLRLETRLKQMTVEYWNLHCHLIGYQPNTKAGKAARKQAATPPIDYPAPIATITPSDPSPKFFGSPPAVPAEDPAGFKVKTEVDVGPDVSKRPSSAVSDAVQSYKRQRMASSGQVTPVNAPDAGMDGALAVQQTDNDAMIIELIEENAQLRSRCAEYEHLMKTLGSKVSGLEKELDDANSKAANLQRDLEGERRRLHILPKGKEDAIRSEEQISVGHNRETFGNRSLPEETLASKISPPVKRVSAVVSVKVEE